MIAAERQRADARERRKDWLRIRVPLIAKAPESIVFIDETSVKASLTRQRGWALRSDRLVMDAPFGSWGTQTFIAGLSAGEMIAPWASKGAMNGAAFVAYIRNVLIPEIAPGTIVILDNLSTHKNADAVRAMRDAGCCFLFLPPPDQVRTGSTVPTSTLSRWPSRNRKRISAGPARDPSPTCSTPSEESARSTRRLKCSNYFKAAGYASS